MPLTPITKSLKAKCAEFASRLKRSAPCPGLLPVPIPVPSGYSGPPCLGEFGETACGPAEVFLDRTLFELSQSNFQVPQSYVGVTFQEYNGAVVPEPSITHGPLGHFVFMAGTKLPAYVRSDGPSSPVPPYCKSQRTSTSLQVHEKRATLYECSDSGGGPGAFELISGHQLLVWKMAGVTCEVSFHGISQVNVDLDLAVANSTTMVAVGHR